MEGRVCRNGDEVRKCIERRLPFVFDPSLTKLDLSGASHPRTHLLIRIRPRLPTRVPVDAHRRRIVSVVNNIGPSGAEHIAEALKVNSSLTQLNLYGASHPRTHLLIRIRPRPPTRVLVDAHRRRIVSSSS